MPCIQSISVAPTASGVRLRWLWPLALAITIFWASEFELIIPNVISSVSHADKGIHFIIFGLVAVSLYRMRFLEDRLGWKAVIVIGISSLYGCWDEIHQSHTLGRQMDVWDWAADTLGATVAVYLYANRPLLRHILETEIRWGRRGMPRI